MTGLPGQPGQQGASGATGAPGELLFVYYSNAPEETPVSDLHPPVVRLADGRWTTPSGDYFWYPNALTVPEVVQTGTRHFGLPPAHGSLHDIVPSFTRLAPPAKELMLSQETLTGTAQRPAFLALEHRLRVPRALMRLIDHRPARRVLGDLEVPPESLTGTAVNPVVSRAATPSYQADLPAETLTGFAEPPALNASRSLPPASATFAAGNPVLARRGKSSQDILLPETPADARGGAPGVLARWPGSHLLRLRSVIFRASPQQPYVSWELLRPFVIAGSTLEAVAIYYGHAASIDGGTAGQICLTFAAGAGFPADASAEMQVRLTPDDPSIAPIQWTLDRPVRVSALTRWYESDPEATRRLAQALLEADWRGAWMEWRPDGDLHLPEQDMTAIAVNPELIEGGADYRLALPPALMAAGDTRPGRAVLGAPLAIHQFRWDERVSASIVQVSWTNVRTAGPSDFIPSGLGAADWRWDDIRLRLSGTTLQGSSLEAGDIFADFRSNTSPEADTSVAGEPFSDATLAAVGFRFIADDPTIDPVEFRPGLPSARAVVSSGTIGIFVRRYFWNLPQETRDALVAFGSGIEASRDKDMTMIYGTGELVPPPPGSVDILLPGARAEVSAAAPEFETRDRAAANLSLQPAAMAASESPLSISVPGAHGFGSSDGRVRNAIGVPTGFNWFFVSADPASAVPAAFSSDDSWGWRWLTVLHSDSSANVFYGPPGSLWLQFRQFGGSPSYPALTPAALAGLRMRLWLPGAPEIDPVQFAVSSADATIYHTNGRVTSTPMPTGGNTHEVSYRLVYKPLGVQAGFTRDLSRWIRAAEAASDHTLAARWWLP